MSVVARLSSNPAFATAIDLDVADRMPYLDPKMRFGPREFIAGQPMWLGKHLVTCRYFRLREKEMFILQQLDGSNTVEDIQVAYGCRFGKLLSKESLHSVLVLFAGCGLVLGFGTEPNPDHVIASLPGDLLSNGPFTKKIVTWDADEWIGIAVRYCKWLINGPVFLFWTLVIVASEVFVFLHRTELWNQFLAHPASSWPLRIVALVLIGSVMMNIHEFGHALICKRYGGAVREMGYLTRYLSFCAYTKIDDILLFHKRRYRVYVLIVGPLISLSLIPLALDLWTHSPPNTFLHRLSVDLLVFYNFGCLVQLFPFLQLDGYFIVAQLLRAPDLRKDSYTYLLRWLLSRFSKREPMRVAKEYAGYLIPLYVFYGLASVVVSIFAIAFLIVQDARQLMGAIGLVPMVVLACVAVSGALFRLYSVTLPHIMSVVGKQSSKGSV